MKTKLNKAIGKAWTLASGICKNHSGKMEGMQSFSTSCTTNYFCKARAMNPDSVCSKCYAQKLSKCRTALEKKNIRNDEIKHRYLAESEIPFLNVAFFRFEAFGDIETVYQVVNYFLVCHKNPHVHFALWTKNPFVIDLALSDPECPSKPENLVIIYSSNKVNIPEKKPFDFIDKVFTVYSKDYIAEHDIDINCGARHCLTCQKCYHHNNGLTEIREQLK